ncbi:PF07386 family protein [Leptospira yanagawae serovar Saopaulo str. Sao Paulo = ATCC 700523]|uniref:PF07386 family protein n=2 Tax=Leptospira yanagawae TaxID=293069 RepID=A0A5E8H7T4_9LEPT|nr:PF07386 family protein [Leptospira yanagawae serovar Saopaulo str. Sao Paulo = ATCC 700523]
MKILKKKEKEPMKKQYLITLIGTTVPLLFFLNCTGTRPDNLGIRSGKLLECPATPNCVSSYADPSDKEHFRAPAPYTKPTNEALLILKQRIKDTPRTKIIKEENNYLYVEYTSLLMRYVDDVEFYFDEKSKLLHFRSASRLGKSDLGVNRKRIETLLKDLSI